MIIRTLCTNAICFGTLIVGSICTLLQAEQPDQATTAAPVVSITPGAPLPLSPSSQPSPQSANAAQPGASSKTLAKAAQNPVANLISVPIQNNFNFGFGPEGKLQNIMNIQPVVPFTLNENWNLITRTIMPIVWQPELAPRIGPESGLGDIQFSLFLSPAKAEGFIWGVGPVFQFPSATDDLLGTGKFTAGPTDWQLRVQVQFLFPR